MKLSTLFTVAHFLVALGGTQGIQDDNAHQHQQAPPEVRHSLAHATNIWATSQTRLAQVTHQLSGNLVKWTPQLFEQSIAALGSVAMASNSALWQVSEACYDTSGGGFGDTSGGGGFGGGGFGSVPGVGGGGGAVAGGGSGGSGVGGVGVGGVGVGGAGGGLGGFGGGGNVIPYGPYGPGAQGQARGTFPPPMIGNLFPMGLTGALSFINEVVGFQMRPIVNGLTLSVDRLAQTASNEKEIAANFVGQGRTLYSSLDLLYKNIDEIPDLSDQRKQFGSALGKLHQALSKLK
ncbi:hypothetical protein TRVA0_003S04456 [Trichomonascus vanleenenianus]|uniref:uncharacterized protein n=1 Tax=Trichomonascus vanleenenianus TaxID=2268995 RepID=UPI003ECADACD